ncbi:type IV secretion system DNA-binding domain-containing protein [Patescibacteria group bacterium]|nr:type IV secretion system DNA-binding domain-containing protein [Patescibacteria group bacterium]
MQFVFANVAPKPENSLGIMEMVYNNTSFFIVADVLALIVLFILLIALVKILFNKSARVPKAFKKVIIQVALPKEASKKSDEKHDTQEGMQQQIGVAENLFSILGGQRAQRGFKRWLWGREDHFSLEIVFRAGLIYFYVAVPKYMLQFMEEHILAQYPEAGIQTIEDYNIFSPRGVVKGCYLKFSREYIFPIKTYLKLPGESLNAITNTLSRIEQDDGAAIQIIARSAKKKWHRFGMKVARHLHHGKRLYEAVAMGKPLSLFKVYRFFSTRTDKERVMQQRQGMGSMQISPMEQETVKGIEEKTSKAGLDINIRIITSAKSESVADRYLSNIVESFSQFNFYQYGNTFQRINAPTKAIVKDFIYRNYLDSKRMILNSEELASIFHFPTPFSETPNIYWLLAKTFGPPPHIPTEGLLLGENRYRGATTKIYIKNDDRRRHMYTIGMTGTGKSVLMSEMIKQDIKNGNGVCVIDPHGNLIDDLLPCIPQSRLEDVVLFDPSDTERPIGLNMLEADTPAQMDFAIQEMIAIFYKLVTDPSMIGPMFEHNMRNAMLTLMADKEHPGTIAEIPRIFTDHAFQKYKLSKVTDPMVRAFWEKEMAKTSDFHKSEMLGYLISKVGRFIENAMVRNIIGQPKSGFNLREIMDHKKILLVNLSKGKVGEVNANLLGLIIVSKLQMAAFTRADLPEEKRGDFYLYIDEFQNFITQSISTILAEARKYRLNLIFAHQYLGQLAGGSGVEGKTHGDAIKDAIFGNVGTIISFRIGVEDTETIAQQFAPIISEYDLINVQKFNAYIRLLVDNQPTKAFNIATYPPSPGNPVMAEKVKQYSREKYGRHKAIIEQEILDRSKLGESASKDLLPNVERSL